jgi:hypothetical protein
MSTLYRCKFGWAVKWHAGPNNTDQKVCEHFLPRVNGDITSIFFKSRKAAREWNKSHYGYIAARRDLRRYPHDWRVPRVVRVSIEIKEIDHD